MLLSEACPQYFTCSASFNYKENARGRCYQHSRLIDEETETQRHYCLYYLGKYLLLVERVYLVNCVGKDIVRREGWGKNPISILCIKTKKIELLRSSKQCPGSFARSSPFNHKENRQVKCYQHSHFIYEETEEQRL